MLLTTADLHEWIGRPAMDPYGEPLGQVSAVLVDSHSRPPEWLLLADPSAELGRLVPVAGAVPTGRQVRVVPTAARVGQAPTARTGEDVDAETKAQAAAHYGLGLDPESSPTSILSDPGARSRQGAAAAPERGRPSGQLIAGLRAAHAMEQASLTMLEAMRTRSRDEELVHDVVLHEKATGDHAERVSARLQELGAGGTRPLDWPAKLLARLAALRGRLRKVPEPGDLDEALRFERGEAKAYQELLELARRAGDERTARVCEENLADEVAMEMTLRNFRLRSDPGFRRGEESPFEAPPEAAELAPET